MTPFKFYKNRRVTSDVEKAFLDIHNNSHEDIFIGLFFKDRSVSPEYAAVLETNPCEESKEADALVSLQAELFLDFAIRDYKAQKLKKEIDDSLDCGNREEFLRLTGELRQMAELG
jgi:uncharacterized protein YpiB (UPF0302 family)